MDTINASALKQKMESDPKVTVVNVLSQDNFDSKHIPGSINIPFEMLDEEVADALPDKGAEIVVHCTNATCPASPRAGAKLEGMGYANIIHFSEGLDGWEKAGFPLEGAETKSTEAMEEEDMELARAGKR